MPVSITTEINNSNVKEKKIDEKSTVLSRRILKLRHLFELRHFCTNRRHPLIDLEKVIFFAFFFLVLVVFLPLSRSLLFVVASSCLPTT